MQAEEVGWARRSRGFRRDEEDPRISGGGTEVMLVRGGTKGRSGTSLFILLMFRVRESPSLFSPLSSNPMHHWLRTLPHETVSISLCTVIFLLTFSFLSNSRLLTFVAVQSCTSSSSTAIILSPSWILPSKGEAELTSQT